MGNFVALKNDLMSYMEVDSVTKIARAYDLAEVAHRGQMRKSGEPYIMHPVAVAHILAGMRMDVETIIAALLHDVLEDTKIGKDHIAKQFGEQVAELVDGVSKLTQIKFGSRAEAQAENFRKMVLAMARDIRVIIIKLADRLHNMRTLESLSPDKRRRIARETLEIYAPLAHRLGMHAFRLELEELGFCALYPLRSRILKEYVRRARGHRKEIITTIETALKECLEKYGLPPTAVWGRKKHLYSIYCKMRDKRVPLNEIMDIYAFRVMVDNVDTCYRALGAVHALYKPVPERFKDYIAIPKANGYQALHTTLFGPYGVPIEIQIRTADMENLAENGIAAHWLYKSSETVASEAELRAREWLKSLLEMQQSTGSSLEFIENVKVDLFPDEVYVFTPRGDIMELPNGSSVVDFAYAVHSDIGRTCVACKIDRRLAPLSTRLSNGQTVEIMTEPQARPNPAWLNFVVTGKARSNIRHALKNLQRTESINFGHQLLEVALQTLKTSLEMISSEIISHVLDRLHYKTLDDLYEAIGIGEQSAGLIARRMTTSIIDQNENLHPPENTAVTPLAIKGTDGIMIKFATCCHPIPDDPIIGILEQGRGMLVHTEQCKHARAIQRHPERYLPLCWSPDVTGDFQTEIAIEVNNQRGVLASIAATLAEAGANIENIHISEPDETYRIVHLLISVRNRIHLGRLIRRLRGLHEIQHIVRRKSEE